MLAPLWFGKVIQAAATGTMGMYFQNLYTSIVFTGLIQPVKMSEYQL